MMGSTLSATHLEETFHRRPFFTTGVILASVFILWLTAIYLKARAIRRRLPPGPTGYPIIGVLFDLPAVKSWLVYDDWCKRYGDLVYFEAFGNRFLLLGSEKCVDDLFEKKSTIYSDRMPLPMLKLMGWEFNLALLPYGENWRIRRRALHQHFSISAVNTHQPIQVQEIRAFLIRLAAAPQNFLKQTHFSFGQNFMKIAYGIEVSEKDDPYLTRAESSVDAYAASGHPGKFWINLFPSMQYIPAWMPGAKFKKFAAHWASVNADVLNEPFDFVRDKMNEGTAVPCVTTTLIESLPDKDDDDRVQVESIARATAALTFLGGYDPSVATAQTFYLAMAMYPAVQRKGQAEIDAVVGRDRLPDFRDRENMPYITSMVKEILRWQPVAPLAYHVSSEDDEYNGYFIPKGTILVANSWSLLHNPETFPNPFDFDPDHYKNDKNPADTPAFGFGRRICPGRYLSCDAIYIFIASILAVFDITPPIDESGNPIQLKPDVTSGLACYPVPFDCVIKFRSAEAEALLRVNEE